MRPRQRMSRSAKVRTPGSILVEGQGDTYGWLSDGIGHSISQNLTIGSLTGIDTTPSEISNYNWWVNGDRDQMGSGFRLGGPHGYFAPPYPGSHSGWWNTPAAWQGAGLLPAITRCTEVITNPILRTTWINTGSDGRTKPLPLWMQDPMLFGGAPGEITSLSPMGRRLTSFQFWDSVITHALWFGCGAFVYREGYEGRPIPGSFMIVNPYMFATDDDGHIVIDPEGERPLRTDFDGRFSMGGNTWRFLCLRGMAPNDGDVPEGVLTRHFDLLRVGAEINGYISSTFRDGVPAGFLKVSTPNMTEEHAATLKKKWMANHGGKRSIAVLNATTDFTPISIKPVDSEIADIKRINLMDVAHAFGLSSAWLDTGDASLTYANLSDRRRDLVDHTLTAWGDRFMEVMSAMMPFGSYCRINWSSYTSPNVETMVQPLVMAVQAGIMSVDEARKYLQLEDRDAPADTTLREEPRDEQPE